ncbi:hypothetical protein LSAT2_000609 [Lamellibrachia satsuma]|nr:hypothetical protein LSAT2_000609 [Lamellibrachia satsuma]
MKQSIHVIWRSQEEYMNTVVRSRKYEHPFGKKADLLGQILCGEREESSENQTDSPAKIIIWMIFFCFMVGVAGAIILGAETAIRSIPRNVTLTTPGPGT